MPKTHKLQKFGIFLFLGCLVSMSTEALAQRGGSPDGMFSRLDSNGDGRIDQSEIGRLPAPFRERMESSGLDFRRGVDQQSLMRSFEQARSSRGDSGGERGFGGGDRSFGGGDRGGDRGSFRGPPPGFGGDRGGFRGPPPGSDRGGSDSDRARYEEFQRRREEYERRRRESEGSNDRSRDDDRRREDDRRRDDDRRREDDRSRDDDRRDSRSRTSFSMRPKERVTVDLPSSFTDGDLDQDGQIGLYEWKQWKRDALSEFNAYDHNRDGFLTPKELQRGPADVEQIQVMTLAATQQRPTTTTSSDSAAATPQANTQPVSTPVPDVDMESVEARRGANTFRLLDQNRNGMIDAEEWERSSKLKPLFIQAGIDINQPLERESFIAYFVQVNAT